MSRLKSKIAPSQLRTALFLLATLTLAGCALPGYHTGTLENSDLYSFNQNTATYQKKLEQDHVTDYKPRVVQITPALLVHQKKVRSRQHLNPDVAKLTGLPQNLGYRVEPGDVIRVVVYGHPELTNPAGAASGNGIRGQLVSSGGNIYFPFAGTLHVAGLTVQQIRRKLAAQLASYIRNPQLNVRVKKYRSQRVYISGDITRPCAVPITDIGLTVVQALGQCNVLQSVQGNNKKGTNMGVRNVLLIRNGQSTLINLNRVYASGKEIPLHANDRLLVDDTANRVFMVGEFGHQTALPYTTGGMSLGDAIADVGGVNLSTADTSAIYVIRGFVSGRDETDGGVKTTMRPNVYHLNMSGPAGMLLANQFRLEPRDVVFAAPASLVNFNRALALITPSLDAIFKTGILYDRVD